MATKSDWYQVYTKISNTCAWPQIVANPSKVRLHAKFMRTVYIHSPQPVCRENKKALTSVSRQGRSQGGRAMAVQTKATLKVFVGVTTRSLLTC